MNPIGWAVVLALLVLCPARSSTLSAADDRSLGSIAGGGGAIELMATVKRVDERAGTVEVTSELLGLFGATLAVTPNTWIISQGKPVPLAALRDGASVRVSYQMRAGRKTANWIRVLSPNSAGAPER